MGLDGVVGFESGFSHLGVSEGEGGGGLGSGSLKQGRSGLGEDEWRSLKMARTDTMVMQPRCSSTLRPSSLYQDQQVLNFSSGKAESSVVTSDGLLERSLQNGTPLGFYLPSASYGRNTGI